MQKRDLDENAIIACYEKYETARVVAEQFNVSDQTVYRVLQKHGIKRTHRHPKNENQKWVSNCRSSFCPSLIVMLRTVLDMNTTAIAKLLGCSVSTVSNVISRRGLQQKKQVRKQDVDLKAIETEYLNGASTYELGKRYGVNHATIGKWMRELGHKRGKGNYPSRKFVDKQKCGSGRRQFEKWLIAEYGDKFTCLEYINSNTPYKLRCNECGSEFTRWPDKTSKIRCQTCYKKELEQKRIMNEQQRQKRKEERKKKLVEEYAKEKICCMCGLVFHNESETAKYCSRKCQRKANHNNQRGRYAYGNHRKRARIYGVAYEPGITLKKLIKRDGLTCKICGGQCDLSDRTSTHVGLSYPTIDHIIALKNGGGHTWDNVQIAHMICNSTKRNLMLDELTEEVIEHAKEQAITNKCA